MNKYIFYAILACMFWGLIFVVPMTMGAFCCVDIVLGRYLVFGIVTLFLFAINSMRSTRPVKGYWKEACICALTMNLVYFISLTMGMRMSSPSLIALIVGLAPLTIAAYECKIKNINFVKSFLWPSLFIFTGVALINFHSLYIELQELNIFQYFLGLLCGVFSLFTWSWYVFYNSNFLAKNKDLSATDWTIKIGIATLFLTLIGIFLRIRFFDNQLDLSMFWPSHPEGSAFIVGVLILGVICSWIAFTLWNISSAVLPPTVGGQIAILETFFGIVFIYSFTKKMPTVYEALGIICIIGGVWKGLSNYTKETKSYD